MPDRAPLRAEVRLRMASQQLRKDGESAFTVLHAYLRGKADGIDQALRVMREEREKGE